jgi:hypothetical protein
MEVSAILLLQMEIFIIYMQTMEILVIVLHLLVISDFLLPQMAIVLDLKQMYYSHPTGTLATPSIQIQTL